VPQNGSGGCTLCWKPFEAGFPVQVDVTMFNDQSAYLEVKYTPNATQKLLALHLNVEMEKLRVILPEAGMTPLKD